MRTGPLETILFSLALVALTAPALAVDRKVPSTTYPTIQDAVDAASDGDRIVIKRGTYFENVVANLDDLTFLARGRVVWDGNVDGSTGKQLEVRGNDTVVQGIRFRNGDYQVDLVGNNTVVRRCHSTGSEESFLSVYGSRAAANPDDDFDSITHPDQEYKATGTRVENNKVDGCFGAGIRIHSDNAVVRANRFTRMTSKGAFVFGDDMLVERNTVNTSFVLGLHCVGDDMRVQRNTLVNVRIKAIGASGDDSMILNNRINRLGVIAGIMWEEDDDETHDDVSSSRYDPGEDDPGGPVSGGPVGGPTITGNRINHGGQIGIRCYDDNNTTGGLVANNVVTNGTTDGIETDIDEMDLTNNRVSNVSRLGFMIEADDVDLTGNRVTNSGSANGTPAFYFEGDDIDVVRCFATNAFGDGFHVDNSSDGVSFTDCVAKNCSEDGFDVDGSASDNTVLLRCKALNCGGEGLDNSGTDTDVTSCTFRNNRINLGNDGTFDTYTGNNVAEGDAETPEVDVDTDSDWTDLED